MRDDVIVGVIGTLMQRTTKLCFKAVSYVNRPKSEPNAERIDQRLQPMNEPASQTQVGPSDATLLSRMQLLRVLLVLDAAVLLLLGALLILAPKAVQLAFHFKDLPAGMSYIMGLWGCVLATMAVGYAVAATDPLRQVVWVQVGIARGALECVLGLIYLARGIVTWQQAAFGIIVAALITIAYIVLYPYGKTGEIK